MLATLDVDTKSVFKMTQSNLKIVRPQFAAPLCAEVDPEIFFPDDEDEDDPNYRPKGNHSSYNAAKFICDRCEHKVECAEWAIQYEPYGFWGGLSPYQRRMIRKERNIRIINPY